MDTDALNKDLNNIFRPLFDELAELDEPLDREEFLDAVNRLYEVSQFV